MKIREFQSELWLPLPPEQLFPFFADAANLDAITPPPIAMREGALIDYRLRVHGITLRWRTRINAWQPPHRFVDEQIRGPYRRWIHEHTFEARDGGTLARDVVRYTVPFDFIAHRWLVRSDIERIFQHRSVVLKKRFPFSPRTQT
jgi:ligand-binding SRPBCC domain-containing protein